MLKNQNLVLIALSVVSISCIYLLYINYQKMQEVSMIKEEIVLLKSTLSKMNNFENEIFMKINDRLKNLEGTGVPETVVTQNISQNPTPVDNNTSELTEENVNRLNQTFENEELPVVEELPDNVPETSNLVVEELPNNEPETTNLVVEELPNNEPETTNLVVEELPNNEELEEVEVLDNETGAQLLSDNIELSEDPMRTNKLNNNVNDKIESSVSIGIDIAQLLKEKGINSEDLIDKPSVEENEPSVEENEPSVEENEPSVEENEPSVEEEATDLTESTTNSTNGLDSFLINNGDSLDDDLDLDDLDDLDDLETSSVVLNESYLSSLTVKELKSISKQKGLKTRGNKSELINIILKGK